jgi:hypothetical protein
MQANYRAGDFLRTRRRALWALKRKPVADPNRETAGAWDLVILCAVLLVLVAAWVGA